LDWDELGLALSSPPVLPVSGDTRLALYLTGPMQPAAGKVGIPGPSSFLDDLLPDARGQGSISSMAFELSTQLHIRRHRLPAKERLPTTVLHGIVERRRPVSQDMEDLILRLGRNKSDYIGSPHVITLYHIVSVNMQRLINP
jgi:hypothetical protein